jgi:DNA-binding transcriptional LysR family regulator
VQFARRILTLRDEAQGEIHDQREGAHTKITIGALESLAQYVLPEVFFQFRQEFPAVEIRVERYHNDAIPRMVRERELDLGFVSSAPPFHGLQSVDLFNDPMVLIVPAGHRLVGRSSVLIKELGSEQFYAHHIRTETTEKLLLLFETCNTQLKVVARLWGFENVKDCVRRGMGVAIVPRSCVERNLKGGEIVEVPVQNMNVFRTLRMVFGDDRFQSQATQHLLKLVRNWKWK